MINTLPKGPHGSDQSESTPAGIAGRLAYSLKETAVMLGISYPTVYRLNKRGLLRSSGALRHKLIPRAEIERFLKTTLE